MLKFIFMSLLMTMTLNSWAAVQLSLFLLCFLYGVLGVSGSGELVNNLGYGFSTDSMSYVLILLSIWIMALVILSSQSVYNTKNYSFIFLVVNLFLLLSLILSFSSMDSIIFYISFETALLPTMILILGWGYQPERIQAGVYMVFYTLFGSLPLLISLFSLYSVCGTTSFCLSSLSGLNSSLFQVWYFCSVLAFVVKLPMFMVHLWLPKAHVEAPVAGSMILAGVLLKLGGYGLLRICPIFMGVVLEFSWVWVSFGLVGGVLVSLMCLRQIDVKSLIAYSSVAHMGLVLSGIMVLSSWGVSGAMGVMIGHGLCSSGLFCLANMSYERTGSRSVLVSKGLLNIMPSLGLWWFLLSISNMAAPPTISLMGEILLITSVMSFSTMVVVSVALLSFLSAAYSLYLYVMTQHGKHFNALFSCSSGNVREYFVLSMHWAPLNALILKSGMFFIN